MISALYRSLVPVIRFVVAANRPILPWFHDSRVRLSRTLLGYRSIRSISYPRPIHFSFRIEYREADRILAASPQTTAVSVIAAKKK